MLEDDLKAIIKPQYVDQIPKAVKGTVKGVEPLIKAKADLGNMEHIMETLGEPTADYAMRVTNLSQNSTLSKTAISVCSLVASFSDLPLP